MTKRKTKAQREQEKKDALLQRIVDIYSGAAGDDASCTDWSAWPEVLARVIPAVRDRFGQPWGHWYGYQAHCLDRWGTSGSHIHV